MGGKKVECCIQEASVGVVLAEYLAGEWGQLQRKEKLLTVRPWHVSNTLFHHSVNTVDVKKTIFVNSVAELLIFVITCQLSYLFPTKVVFPLNVRFLR